MIRSAPRRMARGGVVVTFLGAAILAGQAPAHAVYGDPSDLVLENVVTSPTAVALLHGAPGTRPSITVTSTSTKDSPTDSSGAVLSGVSVAESTYVDSGTSQGTTSYPCVNSGSNANFSVGNRLTKTYSSNKYQYRWQFQAYIQRSARTIAGVPQQQIEWCATGGFDGQNGYRSYYNASVVTVQDRNANRRIGLSYDSGSNKTTASSTLGFEVATGPGPRQS